MLVFSRPGLQGKARRGSTLVLSLIAVVVVVALSGVFMQFTAGVAKRQNQAADQKRSFYMAEAGLAEALAAMQVGKSGAVGSQASPAIFGNGLFWVTVEDLGGGFQALRSTGMCGVASTELDVVVLEGMSSVAALGVFSGGDLTIGSGSLIDSFDSSQGAYGAGSPSGGFVSGWLPQQQMQQGGLSSGETYTTRVVGTKTLYEDIGNRGVARVASNGNVTLVESQLDTTRVLGDVRPGVGGTLSIVGSPEVTGSRQPLSASVLLPPIQVPTLPVGPGLSHTSAWPLVLPPTDGAYGFLAVGTGAHVTITGPTVVVLEDLTVATGGELFLDTTSGPIELIVTDALELAAGSLLGCSGEVPAAVSIRVSGTTPVQLRALADFYGSVYAPSAEVQIQSGFDVFGSVVGAQLTLDGPCEVHFDVALGRAAQADALPALVSWRIVELNGNASPGGDPFVQLGVDASLLDQPADAHSDQPLEVQYYPRSGPPALTYDGPESAFEWSDVSQVLTLERDGQTVGDVGGLAGIGGLGDGSGMITSGERLTGSDVSPVRVRVIAGT